MVSDSNQSTDQEAYIPGRKGIKENDNGIGVGEGWTGSRHCVLSTEDPVGGSPQGRTHCGDNFHVIFLFVSLPLEAQVFLFNFLKIQYMAYFSTLGNSWGSQEGDREIGSGDGPYPGTVLTGVHFLAGRMC